MSMYVRKIRCLTHGILVLSDAEYDQQMDSPNADWKCTVEGCPKRALFVGEYYPCKCGELVEVGEDVCTSCGIDNYEEYLSETEI
jgi:hypothetical protein